MAKMYPFVLDQLPYGYSDLEEVIDTTTMQIHHDKHHQTYVDNLNKLLVDKTDLQAKPLEELLGSEITGVKNNAGGVWNHDFYWQEMVKPGSSVMSAELKMEIEKSFVSVDKFMEQFEAVALGRFGSGWAWLVKKSDGGLEILSTANQDNPLVEGKTPLLAIDVWEHAYYLKYQNRRAEHVRAWWRVVNWQLVEERLRG